MGKKRKNGEFELIEWIRKRAGGGRGIPVGIGDDAALLSWKGDKGALVTTDTLVEGVHFLAEELSAYRIGWKALATNLSDIAAMGGKPAYALLTLALPRSRGKSFLQGFWRGWEALAKQFEVRLVGGDTVSSPGPLVISVTLLGTVTGSSPILRTGAAPGDAIVVTGNLGGSQEGRHAAFRPRVREGMHLATRYKVNAMIDISDGLLGDLGHILIESGVGAELEEASIPIASAARRASKKSGRSSLDHALRDGEDYELLFTLHPKEAKKVLEKGLFSTPVTCIGSIIERGFYLVTPQRKRKKVRAEGYDHFG